MKKQLRSVFGIALLAVLLNSVGGVSAQTVDPLAAYRISSTWSGHAYTPSPADWRKIAVYQIMTDRFANGDPNNDHAQNYSTAYDANSGDYPQDQSRRTIGGDFKGLTENLDYIKSLGFDAIWISAPLMGAEPNGYAPTTYGVLDKKLGTVEEFRTLINEAHARGMYVIIDCVANHFANWFNDNNSYNGGGYGAPTYKYGSDRNYGANFGDPIGPNDFHNNGWINDWNNQDQLERGELVGLDDLRTENEWVRNYVIEKWSNFIKAFDIDGFRVDAIKHINIQDMATMAQAWRAAASSVGKTNFYMFGEAFSGSHGAVGYYTGNKAGTGKKVMNGMMDYAMYMDGVPWKLFSDQYGLKGWIEGMNNGSYDMGQGDGTTWTFANMNLHFADNHDNPRFISTVGDWEQMAAVTALLTTIEGVGGVYYGSEQAFNTGGKDGRGAYSAMFDHPYQFDNAAGDNFNMNYWLYQKIAKIMRARRRIGAGLGFGTDIQTPQNGIFAFKRGADALVAINGTNSQKSATFSFGTGTFTDLVNGGTATGNANVTLSKYGVGIFVKNADPNDLEPMVEAIAPAHAARENVAQVVVTFDRAMDPVSTIAAASISPNPGGTWSVSGRTLTLTGATFNKDWMYTVKVARTAKGTNGRSMLGGFTSRFWHTGGITPPPPPATSPEINGNKVTFRYSGGTNVSVKGNWKVTSGSGSNYTATYDATWNGGAKTAMVNSGGVWSVTLTLDPTKTFEYGFDVNGVWTNDPANPNHSTNGNDKFTTGTGSEIPVNNDNPQLKVNGADGNYGTTRIFVDENRGDIREITVEFAAGSDRAVTDVECFTNLDRRDFATLTDVDASLIEAGSSAPTYFKAYDMYPGGIGHSYSQPVRKTGVYRVTVRYKVQGDPNWRWYSNGSTRRDAVVVVSPEKARNLNMYELQINAIEATDDNWASRSTFADLTSADNDGYNPISVDSLRGQGINTVWLQPIHPIGSKDEPAPFNQHGDPGSPYAVKNFFAVNQVLGADNTREGALQEFKQFVSEADVKGLNVFFDVTFNHSAWDVEIGPYGSQIGAGPTSQIRDVRPQWYTRRDASKNYLDSNAYLWWERARNKNEIAVAPADRHDFGKWPDVTDFFFGTYSALGSPKNEQDALWNHDSTVNELVDYFANYSQYWLEQTGNTGNQSQSQAGIDGFRCDFAQGVPPQAWEYIINKTRSKKWDFIFMAESLDGGEVSRRAARQFDIVNDNWVWSTEAEFNPGPWREAIEKHKAAYDPGMLILRNVTTHDHHSPEDPWMAAMRTGVHATVYGVPLVFAGMERGLRMNYGYEHFLSQYGRYHMDFKNWNDMKILWDSSPVGMPQFYSNIMRAREQSAALKSGNQWFLFQNNGQAHGGIFAVAKWEPVGGPTPGTDVVLAFVNMHYWSASNGVFDLGGTLGPGATRLGLIPGASYNVVNLASSDPSRRLWSQARTTNDILTNGIYVGFNGKKHEDGQVVQYLKFVNAASAPDPNLVEWTPSSAAASEAITIKIGRAGKLMWGVNASGSTWIKPDASYRPAGSAELGATAIESPFSGPDADGKFTITIGPFLGAQTIQSLDFVIHYPDNTWNNNGGADFHAPVAPRPVIVDTVPPAVPTGLTGTPGPLIAALRWNANSEADLDGYDLYYRVYSNGVPQKVNSTRITGTEYVATNLAPMVEFTYYVVAVDRTGNISLASATVSVIPLPSVDTTPPAAPTGVVAVGGTNQIVVSWNENGERDVEGYYVYTRPSGTTTWTLIMSVAIPSATYTHTGLATGATHEYYIAARDASGNTSVGSSVATGRTLGNNTGKPPIYISFLWHMHQPIYYPGEYLTQTEAAGRYGFSPIGVHFDRTGPYTTWPVDAVQNAMNAGLEHAAAQVSFSGSLTENLDNLESNGRGFFGWKNRWHESNNWKTSLGNPRVDLVAFGYHHPLMTLVDNDIVRQQIRDHREKYLQTWNKNGVPARAYSKGMFPAENAFAERIIPALVDEGIEWVMVDNIHFQRAAQGYPYSAGGNLYPPNKADQQNPNPNDWVQLNGVWAPTKVSARWSMQPHYVQSVDPVSGQIKRIIAVPTERYMGNEDGRGGFGALQYEAVMSQIESQNTDPNHPALIVLHHDGDNYGGGTEGYYHGNFSNFINWVKANPSRFQFTGVQDYLQMFPPDPSDVIHVEAGSWAGADNGDPEFLKWNGDPNATTGYSPDWNSWGVMMASANRVLTAQSIDGGNNSVKQAVRHLLNGFASDYWYWDGTEIWDGLPAVASNLAVNLADPVIPNGVDIIAPTLYAPQRNPYNPGELEWGTVPKPRDFEVWTWGYDVAGIQSINVKYRLDIDGANPITSTQNEVYGSGSEVGEWITLPMSVKTFPPQVANPQPRYRATMYSAMINGLSDKLVDYYVEATDNRGNLRRSPIEHVWVGTGGTGGGGGTPVGVSWNPGAPAADQAITISNGRAGKLHWGINTWIVPPVEYRPAGSTVMSTMAIQTPMTDPDSDGVYTVTIGPFSVAPVTGATTVTKIDFVIANADGTWNNNGGADFHITVGPPLNSNSRDTTPPIITLALLPASTTASSVTVSGTVNEPATVKVNNTTVVVTFGAFSTTVNLAIGANTITVTATDSSNNTATSVRSIQRNTMIDTTRPVIDLDSQPTTTTSAQLTIAGDVIPVTSTVTINGASVTVSAAGRFSGNVMLTIGENLITVVARTAAGLTATQILEVTRETVVILDAPPAAPAGLTASAQIGQITIAWNANSENDIRGYYLNFRVSGTTAWTQLGGGVITGTNFTHTGLSSNSTYEYYISAVDNANQTSAGSSVTSAKPLVASGGQVPIYIAYHWHMHQPIYWPYENIVSTYRNRANYSFVRDVVAWPDRVDAYTHNPIDNVDRFRGMPNYGAQISYSGSLAENLDNMGAANDGYNSGWANRYAEGHTWQTALGNRRVDLVAFGYHHPLMPLIDSRDMRLQIQMHRKKMADKFGGPYSKGMFPPESAFSERMIPALLAEGIEWVMVDNLHIDHANKNFPWTMGEKINPPNRADAVNAPAAAYINYSCQTNTNYNVAPSTLKPHYAKYVDPNTGTEMKVIVVPLERSLGYDDSYGDRTPQQRLEAMLPHNTDPAHPILIVLAHDGDNAGASGHRYYVETMGWVGGADPNKFRLTTIQDYLSQFPPAANDVVHATDGSWVGADLGDQELHKWMGDPVKSGQVNFDEGYSSDWNSWMAITAGKNRLLTAEKIMAPSADIGKIVYNNGNNMDKAWHEFLVGEASCYWYWDGTVQWDEQPSRAANQAMAFADPIIASNMSLDAVPPSLFSLQREPYNPGGEEAFKGTQASDFRVFTFGYDVNSIAAIKLMYRIDADGDNPISTNVNEVYSQSAGVGAWIEIPMTVKAFPNPPAVQLQPLYRASVYEGWIRGLSNTLVDYYVEAVDGRGNVAKTDIHHVYVGNTSTGGGTNPTGVNWTPTSPRADQTIVVSSPKAGKLHWGVNGWTAPAAEYRPAGTTVFSTLAVQTPLVGPDANGRYAVTIGPFTGTQAVTSVKFVIAHTDGSWNNNGGSDFSITVSPAGPIVIDTTAPVLTLDAATDSTIAASVLVGGAVDDASAIVKVNNIAVTLAATLRFSKLVDLSVGLNTITLTATDASNNATTRTVTVTRGLPPVVPDTVAPVIVLNPTAGTTQSASQIISGSVSEPATVKVNEIAAPVSVSGTFTTSVALIMGANTITVTATDSAGNAAIPQTVSIMRQPVIIIDTRPTWSPSAPNSNDVITVVVRKPCKLRWGVNAWKLPDASYRPAGSLVWDTYSIETPFAGPNAAGAYTLAIGPFNGAVAVTEVNFVLHYSDNTWDNNGGLDYRIAVAAAPAANRPPTVSITSPRTGDTVTGAATITATASDDRSVPAVTFSIGGTVLGTVTTPIAPATSGAPAVILGAPGTITIDGTNTNGEWTEAMRVSSDPAWDHANVVNGAWSTHETPFDYTDLYAAWDAENLYIGIQIVDITDLKDPANAGSSAGTTARSMNLPQFIALDVKPGGYTGVTPTGTNSAEYDAWHKGHLWNNGAGVDYQVYFASNFWQGPFLVPYNGSWSPNTTTIGPAGGLAGKSGAGLTRGKVYDAAGNEYVAQGHNKARDSFFEVKIPLRHIGNPNLNSQTIGIFVAHGDGDMKAGVDCIPNDPATSNTSGVEVWNSPKEWADIDIYTTPFVPAGSGSGSGGGSPIYALTFNSALHRDGPYEISATAIDSDDSRTTVSVNVNLLNGNTAPDTIAPVLTINVLPESVTSSSVTVSGTVNDTTASVRINQSAVSISSTGAFSWPLPLNLGANTITVVATDAYGNSATKTVTIVRENPPDPNDPFGAYKIPANWTAHQYTASPTDWRSLAVYQVMTDRFFDGDATNNTKHIFSTDFNAASTERPFEGHRRTIGGDIKGMTAHLDYIKSLGFDVIWISAPLIGAEANGYAPASYNVMDPKIGTVAEFRSFVDEAHARGMYVVIDCVSNHFANWFADNETFNGNGYGTPQYAANAPRRYGSQFGDAIGPDNFHNHGKISNWTDVFQLERGELVGLDDLRTEDAYVKNYVIEKWANIIKAFDVDGFRVDAIKHVNVVEMGMFAQAWRDAAKSVGKNNFFMFGEAFSSDHGAVGYYTGNKSGTGRKVMNGMMDYAMHQQGIPWKLFNDPVGLKNWIAGMNNSSYDMGQGDGSTTWTPANMNVHFADNHDLARFLSTVGDRDQMAAMTAMLTMIEGLGAMYYGGEQGFNTGGTDGRGAYGAMYDHDFEWDAASGDNFNMTHDLYKKIARIMRARRRIASGLGTTTNLNDPQSGIFSFKRGADALVAINGTSGSATATLNFGGGTWTDLVNGTVVTTATASVTLPKYATAIFIRNGDIATLEPLVESITPAHGISSGETTITITFDRAMDPAMTASAASVSPVVGGTWSVAGSILKLTGATFSVGTEYTVRVDRSARGANGAAMSGGFLSRFKAATPGTGGPIVSPQVSGTNVTFRYSGGSSASIKGSWKTTGGSNGTYTAIHDATWNGGVTTPMVNIGGVWTVTIGLQAGKTYEYGFMINNAWTNDPVNTNHAASGNDQFSIAAAQMILSGSAPTLDLAAGVIYLPLSGTDTAAASSAALAVSAPSAAIAMAVAQDASLTGGTAVTTGAASRSRVASVPITSAQSFNTSADIQSIARGAMSETFVAVLTSIGEKTLIVEVPVFNSSTGDYADRFTLNLEFADPVNAFVARRVQDRFLGAAARSDAFRSGIFGFEAFDAAGADMGADAARVISAKLEYHSDASSMNGRALKDLSLHYYNPSTGAFEPLETKYDAITNSLSASLRHLSVYGVAPGGAGVQTSLSGAIIYPNPFVPGDADANNGVEMVSGNLNTGIIFDRLTDNVTISIYTLRGLKVAEQIVTTGRAQWDAKTSDGTPVATGVYLVVIKDNKGRGSITQKIAVMR